MATLPEPKAIPKQSEPTATPKQSAPTAITKHSLMIAGHRTSISLETAFWDALKAAAASRAMPVAALVAEIDAGRGTANLSSAIRVFLFARADSARADLARANSAQ